MIPADATTQARLDMASLRMITESEQVEREMGGVFVREFSSDLVEADIKRSMERITNKELAARGERR